MQTFSRAMLAGPVFLLALMLASMPVSAQVIMELSGEYERHNDRGERPGGDPPGDYLGIPLNDMGRMRANTSNPTDWGLPEFQCRPHPAPYQWRANGNVRFIKEIDPVSRQLTAYHVQWLRALDRPIYMDGRPHPPEWAPHTWSGFSTGRWDGNTLVVTTTHLKEGYLRRNNVPFSDRARMTEYIILNDDRYLLIVMVLEDPIYLEEPFIETSNYLRTTDSQLAYYPCTIIQESTSTRVPHFLPGQNPYLTDWLAEDGIPEEAAQGGAATLYPEYKERVQELLAAPSTPSTPPN